MTLKDQYNQTFKVIKNNLRVTIESQGIKHFVYSILQKAQHLNNSINGRGISYTYSNTMGDKE